MYWFRSSLRSSLCALSLSAAFVAQAQDTPSFDPSRFEVTPLVSGLRQPMELSIASDGSIYFIELEGKLQRLDRKTNKVELVGEVKITTAQENGLIGMTLDPKFAQNGWVYLQYSPPDYPGQHISRFTIVDGKLDLTSEKLLLKFEEQRKECCHHAGSMMFGPDGNLYVSTGDNTHPHADSNGFAPIDERPDRAPWDAQKSSANTNSLSGKILRIRPNDDGTMSIPDGNLFAKDGSKGRPEIYVMGCRNPWRMTVDQRNGFVYWGEVGPDAGGDGPRGPRGYDEINQAKRAGNFGWPYFIANNLPYVDYDYATMKLGEKFNVDAPVNESPNNTGEKLLPPAQPALLYYPGGPSKEFPELGSGGRTACAGPVYYFDSQLKSGTKFPAEFNGVLFIYEWTRHWIKAVHLDEQGNVKRIEPFLPQQKFVRPIDMQFGPEGSLYVIEYGETWGVNKEARLIRIDYVTGNRAPIVVASAENNIGKQPLAVKLSSKGTFDKDAKDELKFEWRVHRALQQSDSPRPGTPGRGARGEGQSELPPSKSPSPPTPLPGVPGRGENESVTNQPAPTIVSNEANPTVNFDQPGVFNVELVVTDTHGAKSSASVPVLVGNERPTIRFLEPQVGDFFDPEQSINYRLIVKDAEDGTNDDDDIDKNDAPEIDRQSPGRTSVNATYVLGAMPSANGSSNDEQAPAGMKLMKTSDCFNCHAVDQKRVGPPFLEIATKYKKQAGALDASVQRVIKGSSGVWGKVPMIPHGHNTPEEIREMVSWVYSLEPAGLTRVFPGFVNTIPVAKDETSKPGYFRLEANYIDGGAGEIPPLTASVTMLLRPRLIEAETADEIHGPQVLSSGNASAGKFVGAINHGHFIRMNGITTEKVRKVTLKLASAGAGGSVEIRLDKPNGELLATVPVEVNGQWEKFYERTAELPETKGRHDVFIRFVHPTKAGGLMNLDSVNFLP